jgi:hypothetical protein
MNALAARLKALGATATAAARELRRIPRENARHEPHPPSEGLILDVGGGQSPHPKANVVVDKYVVDDFERAGPLGLTKPLIVADGHALPFADRTFAYVIAMHVLEHATDPVRFSSELARVAEAGFVQLPTAEAELTLGWPFHPWLVEREGDTLVFRPKGERRAAVGQLFHDAYQESALMRLWWASDRSRWHHSLEWRGHLGVRVEGESAADETASLDLERTLSALAQLAESAQLAPLGEELRSALRCPVDGGDLEVGRERAVCQGCERAYPIVGEVPVLLDLAAS